VIVDEIHEAINDRTRGVLELLSPWAVFGLTATLQLRKKHIRYQAAAMAGPVVYTYPLQQGVKEGYLARGLIVRIDRSFGKDARLLRRGGSENRYLEAVVDNTARNQYVAELAAESARRGHPTIVLVDRLLHLDNLHAELAQRFPHFRMLSGEDSKETRAQAIQEMREGRLRLILTNRIFGKGVDIPNLEVVIDASGRQSHNAAQQRFGRGTRKNQGKVGLIHFDIADRNLPATQERRKAYRKLKMPMVRCVKPLPPEKLLDLAEQRLRHLYNSLGGMDGQN